MSQLRTRAPRREIDLPVSLSFEDAGRPLFGASRNISSTGMLVLSKGTGQPGTRVSFECVPASGVGEVVWARTDEAGETWIGMRFVELARGDHEFFPDGGADLARARWGEELEARPKGDFNFPRVADFLLQQDVSVAEIAFALGTSAESIRVARELPGPEGARELPEDWREQIADLVRGRGARLEELGRQLKGW